MLSLLRHLQRVSSNGNDQKAGRIRDVMELIVSVLEARNTLILAGLPEHKAPSTGVADVVAAAQANVTRSRLSRFDVPSPPLTGLPQHQQRMTSSSDQSVSPYFSQMCNLQERSVATTVPPPVNLDSKLQIWKYHVFSSHKVRRPHQSISEWRGSSACISESTRLICKMRSSDLTRKTRFLFVSFIEASSQYARRTMEIYPQSVRTEA